MDQRVKDLIDRAKVTAATAATAAGKVADSATKKAGGIVELTKLNLQIFDLNTDVELLMKEIGKAVYLTHTGAEINPEDINAMISQIDLKYEKISQIKAEIAEKKAVTACPVCSCECDKEDAFCRICGSKMQ